LEQTVFESLGIELIEATPQRVEVRMEVCSRVHQPYGFLHGGVSVLLAETCASIGADLASGEGKRVFGMEINANHLRPVRAGYVRAVGTPIHLGRTSQVWDARVVTESDDKLVCISRCTLAVVDAERVR
jgi:uncharacterized protein (TIGR00369 family)